MGAEAGPVVITLFVSEVTPGCGVEPMVGRTGISVVGTSTPVVPTDLVVSGAEGAG